MNINESRILEEFKKCLIMFLDEFITQFPTNSELVKARIYLCNQIKIKNVLESFIFKINTQNSILKKMIKDHDENFFLEYNLLECFGYNNEMNSFRKIWRTGNLDTENKNIVWKWLDSFLFFAEKYSNIK